MSKRSVSRRQFLKKATATAGALALPTIIPNTALGLNGAVAPSNRIVMATIGLGQMGPADMLGLIEKPETQFVAVCDVDAARCKQWVDRVNTHYAEKLGKDAYQGCAAYSDYREVIGRDDIDAVIVATPDHWHALMVIQAAQAGKDIYCEKPLSLTITEGIAMREAVNRYGRVLQVGSQSRSLNNTRYACELVRNGRIGELQRVEVGLPTLNPDWIIAPPPPAMPIPPGFDYNMWLGPAPWAPYTKWRCHIHFRWILDYSNGFLADIGAHQIDLAHWGMDMEHSGPVEIEGKGYFPKGALTNVAVTYNINLTYSNGLKMLISTDASGGARFFGTKGWIHTSHGGSLNAKPKSLLTSIIGPNEIHLYDSRDHHQNFVDCVLTRKRNIAPVEVGHRVATVANLANIAMLLERKIRWDPVAERIVNDPEAERMMARAYRSPWHL